MPTKAKSKNSHVLLIGAIGGAAVLCVLCGTGGIAGYFLWSKAAKGPQAKDPQVKGPQAKDPEALEREAKDPQAKDLQAKAANLPNLKKRPITLPISGGSIDPDLANDPKWLEKPDLQKMLPGRWRRIHDGIDFSPDGILTRHKQFSGPPGSYKVSGPESIQVLGGLQPPLPGQQPSPQNLVVLINEDEVALLQKLNLADSKPTDHILVGAYYRMRDDGTGLGRIKLIDPEIAKIKGGGNDAHTACSRLESIGPDAWPALPALIELLEKKDKKVVFQAMGTLAAIGPKAKDAVPVLRKYLKEKDATSIRLSAMALGKIGPAAKDALPDLRAHGNIDGAIVGAIERIEGKRK